MSKVENDESDTGNYEALTGHALHILSLSYPWDPVISQHFPAAQTEVEGWLRKTYVDPLNKQSHGIGGWTVWPPPDQGRGDAFE